MHGVEGDVASATRAHTERRDLGHIEPEAAIRNLLVPFDPGDLSGQVLGWHGKYVHLFDPPRNTVGRHPIREDSVPWPYSAEILTSVRVLEECSRLVAASVGVVGIAGILRVRDVDGRINNRYKVLPIPVQPAEEIGSLGRWEGDRVKGEVAVLVHVVDVQPDGFCASVSHATNPWREQNNMPSGISNALILSTTCLTSAQLRYPHLHW